MTVRDALGNRKNLANMLAQGGEGCVYPLTDRTDVLVKVYHADKLAQVRARYQRKVEAMVSKKDQLTNLSLCWPLLSVFDEQQHWIGYAMKKAQGVPMSYLAHTLAYQKHFPNLDRVMIVKYLLSYLSTIEILHSKGVMIGDYNLQNFLCDKNSYQVTLIDCDSYQVMVDAQHYPCPVGSPDLTPIEHHGKDFTQVVRTVQSELFSVAIVLFQCLMLGRHPYDVIGGEDRVSNLKKGNFAYGIGGKGIPKGAWYNIWSHMPSRLKGLFIQVFKEGVSDTSMRPSIQEWQLALGIYLNELNKGWHNTEIKPVKAKEDAYKGTKSLNNRSFSRTRV
jgi:DNA-binding helix-hairpin-helix protein with protein kinase domain